MPDIPLLNPMVLNGVVEKFTAPENMLGVSGVFGGDRVQPNPEAFISYDIIEGNREKAAPNVPNAEAHIVRHTGVGHFSSNMMYLREKKVFGKTTMSWLRQPGTMAAKNATAAILREIKDLDNRFNKFAEFAIWQILTTGALSITAEGIPLALDFGFQTTHKPTVSVDWDHKDANGDYDADIFADLESWKSLIAVDAQAVATDVYVNSTGFNLLRNNKFVKALMTDAMKQEIYNSGVVRGLLGFNWIVYDLAYVDDAGAVQKYIPDGKLVMLSNDNDDRWYFYNGPSADWDAPEGHIGKFSKTWQEPDPSARQYLLEWHLMPAIPRVDQIVAATIYS